MDSRRKLVALAAATILSTAAVTACSSSGAGSGQGGEGGSEAKEIRIAVSQWPSLAFAVPYEVAMEEGYFKGAGIKIKEVIAGSGGGTTVRSILAGDLSFGEVATSALVKSQGSGKTLVAVGGGAQKVGEIVWVAPKNSPLSSIKDLPGHTVGYTNAGSVTQSTLALSLDRAGVNASKVKTTATGGVSEGLTAMKGGAVDATIHSDPLYADQASDYKLLWRATDYVKDYQQTVIVTSPQLAKSDPALVRAFLSARAKALDFMRQNPQKAARIWSDRGDVPLAAAKSTMKTLLGLDEWNVGFNPAGLRTAAAGMKDAGLLKGGKQIKWSDYIDQSYLPDDVKTVKLP